MAGSPTLVFGLWDSCKYMFKDSMIINGSVEPDPEGHPIPKHLGSPGS